MLYIISIKSTAIAIFICQDSNLKSTLASDSEIPRLWSNSTQSQLPKHIPAYVWLSKLLLYLWGSISLASLSFTRLRFNCLPNCRMLDHSFKQRCERNPHRMAECKNDRNNQKRVLDFLRVSSYTYNRNTFDLQVRVEETAQRASKISTAWGSNTLCSNIYQPELPYSI